MKMPEEDCEPAEPRHGPQVHPPRLARLVDDAEDAGDAADRRRQDDDDGERDEEAPEDVLGCDERVKHDALLREGTLRILRDGGGALRDPLPGRSSRPVEPVAGVAEARHDVAALVQLAVDGRDDDVHVGMVRVQRARSPRAPR